MMGRKRKHVDYRQLYKDYYGIDFDSDMVVHHIDFDRSNNSIDNLILLPNKVHAKYHYAIQMLTNIDMSKSLNRELQLKDLMCCIHNAHWLRIMADALDEAAPWIRMKYDYKMLPEDVFRSAYHTDYPITERSVM